MSKVDFEERENASEGVPTRPVHHLGGILRAYIRFIGVGLGDVLREIPLGSSAFKWRITRNPLFLQYLLLYIYA
jgi:hypothetical protein